MDDPSYKDVIKNINELKHTCGIYSDKKPHRKGKHIPTAKEVYGKELAEEWESMRRSILKHMEE